MTSAAVDAAIERAVGWLQRAQRPDGLWNLPATTDHIGTIRQIAEYVITNRVVKRSQPEREARLLAQHAAQRLVSRAMVLASQDGLMNSCTSCSRATPISPATTGTRSSGSAKRFTNGLALTESVNPT